VLLTDKASFGVDSISSNFGNVSFETLKELASAAL
jgi:hypothetical protein